MKFNNLPAKVKRTPEQNAILAFKAHNHFEALQIVLGDMTMEQQIRFFIHSFKVTKFKTYRMGIENLENTVENFLLTKDVYLVTKYKRSLQGSNDAFTCVCDGIATYLIKNEELNMEWLMNIPIITYETSYGPGYERKLMADILEFRYNNTNFGLLYADK